MRWKPLLAESVVFITGCAKESKVKRYNNEYLGPWLMNLTESICQLERNHPNGLDPAKRVCPGGPPEVIIPRYPPP